MADEPVVPTTTGPEAEPQATPTETVAETTPAEAKPETPTETVVQPEVVEKPKQTWKLKRGEKEIEISDEAELLSLASRGLDYQARVQALAEADKGRQTQDQLAGLVMNNPAVLKAEIARQNGLDPSVVLTDPRQPDEGLLQYDAQTYYRMKAEADLHARQKAWIDSAFENLSTQTRQQVNNSVFEVGRATHNLSDDEFSQVRQFVESTLRPSPAGTYSKSHVDLAVKALFGERKNADAKLAQTRAIQETVRRAASSAPASASPKQEEVDPAVASAKAYREWVKEMSGS